SYWFASVLEVCRLAREILPDAKLVVLGNYPRLNPEHAEACCVADLLVGQTAEVADLPAAFDLYGDEPPPFIAFRMNSKVAVKEVTKGVTQGLLDFTFFEDDVLRDDGVALAEIVEKTEGLHRHLRYHLICGVRPDRITPRVAKLLCRPQIAEVHFEELDD